VIHPKEFLEAPACELLDGVDGLLPFVVPLAGVPLQYLLVRMGPLASRTARET
jgi:hypothetical protein